VKLLNLRQRQAKRRRRKRTKRKRRRRMLEKKINLKRRLNRRLPEI